MSSRDWFGVGVRLIGLWEIVCGLEELVGYGNVVAGISSLGHINPNGYLTHAAEFLLVGFFLLIYAMSVVNAVYPPPEVAKNEPPTAT